MSQEPWLGLLVAIVGLWINVAASNPAGIVVGSSLGFLGGVWYATLHPQTEPV